MISEFRSSDFINVKFDLSTQFHILKHFTKIDKDYLEFIVTNTEYSYNEISDCLQERTSKFYFEFAKNPVELKTLIEGRIENSHVKIKNQGNRIEIQITFAKMEYPNGIGVDCLLHIEEVLKEKMELLKSKNDDLYNPRTVKGKSKPTWDINLILQKGEIETKILTIFPGIYAPPFPNKELQSKEEFMRNLHFWNNHCILQER